MNSVAAASASRVETAQRPPSRCSDEIVVAAARGYDHALPHHHYGIMANFGDLILGEAVEMRALLELRLQMRG